MDRSPLDSRRVELFLHVVDDGGFTNAADELGISQPAVSQAIRELERELGTALFVRVGRTVALTAAGRALVEPARQLRRDLAIGEAAVAEVVGLSRGELDLACLPTLAAAPLSPLVGAFRVAYPGVLVRLAAPEDSGDLLDLVRSGRAEVGILDGATPPTGLVAHVLGEQDFLLVYPPESDPPAHTSFAKLASAPFVASSVGTSSRALLDEACNAAGITATIAVEAGQREALLPLVLAGAGIALLPRPLADLAAGLGCRVVATTPVPRRNVVLVTRAGPLTPAAAAFVDLATADERHRTANVRQQGRTRSVTQR